MAEHESKFIKKDEDEASAAFPCLVCDLDQVEEIYHEYLADCSTEDLGLDDQQLELQLASFGDEEAKLLLFELNKRRVVMTARNYSGRGVEFDDLVQEGSIALLRAIETFNQNLGRKFGDYANLLIQRSMVNALIDYSRTIRISKHMFDALGELYNLDQQSNSDLTIGEVSSRLLVKPEKAEKIMRFNQQSIISIDAMGEGTLDDVMYEKDQFEPATEDLVIQKLNNELERQDIFDSMAAVLSEREQKVISMRFGLETGEKQTSGKVGRLLGVSRQFINKIEKRSIKKLKKFYGLE